MATASSTRPRSPRWRRCGRKSRGDPSLAAPEKIDIFFKHLDANGDGFVDKSEIEAMRSARASAPPPEAPQGDAPAQDAN